MLGPDNTRTADKQPSRQKAKRSEVRGRWLRLCVRADDPRSQGSRKVSEPSKKKALAIARQRLKFVDDGWRVSATHLRTF